MKSLPQITGRSNQKEYHGSSGLVQRQINRPITTRLRTLQYWSPESLISTAWRYTQPPGSDGQGVKLSDRGISSSCSIRFSSFLFSPTFIFTHPFFLFIFRFSSLLVSALSFFSFLLSFFSLITFLFYSRFSPSFLLLSLSLYLPSSVPCPLPSPFLQHGTAPPLP